MTNGDALRKMSDEDLIPFLMSLDCPPAEHLKCSAYETVWDDTGDPIMPAGSDECIECWRTWLKQEVDA